MSPVFLHWRQCGPQVHLTHVGSSLFLPLLSPLSCVSWQHTLSSHTLPFTFFIFWSTSLAIFFMPESLSASEMYFSYLPVTWAALTACRNLWTQVWLLFQKHHDTGSLRPTVFKLNVLHVFSTITQHEVAKHQMAAAKVMMMSSFLTAHQHILGYLEPQNDVEYVVKNQREPAMKYGAAESTNSHHTAAEEHREDVSQAGCVRHLGSRRVTHYSSMQPMRAAEHGLWPLRSSAWFLNCGTCSTLKQPQRKNTSAKS